jgi:hypothetical protein
MHLPGVASHASNKVAGQPAYFKRAVHHCYSYNRAAGVAPCGRLVPAKNRSAAGLLYCTGAILVVLLLLLLPDSVTQLVRLGCTSHSSSTAGFAAGLPCLAHQQTGRVAAGRGV